MKKIQFRALILVLVAAASQSANAVLFDISATYTDGTTFMATYDDPDGDGICPACTLTAASATAGAPLALFFRNSDSGFSFNLPNLLDDTLKMFSVSNIGPDPIFDIVFNSLDNLGYIDKLGFAASGYDVYDEGCRDPRNEPAQSCAMTNRVRLVDGRPIAGATIAMRTPNRTIPEPTTLSLLGLSLAGLGWSRRKRTH